MSTERKDKLWEELQKALSPPGFRELLTSRYVLVNMGFILGAAFSLTGGSIYAVNKLADGKIVEGSLGLVVALLGPAGFVTIAVKLSRTRLVWGHREKKIEKLLHSLESLESDTNKN